MTDEQSYYYFAFGSNLSVEQMAARCPSSRVIGCATLSGARIAFAGQSATWNAHGVATIVDDDAHTVPGLLYVISESDVARLDRYEGHPHSYQRETRAVHLDGVGGSDKAIALTYVKRGEKAWAPSSEYLRIIAEGYEAIGATDAQRAALAVAAGAPRPPRKVRQAAEREALARARGRAPVRGKSEKGKRRAARRLASYSDRPQLDFDDVASHLAGGLGEMVGDAWRRVRDGLAGDVRIDESDRPVVRLYDVDGFDPDRFVDRVCDALRDDGDDTRADAFALDVMIAEVDGPDDLRDLASRFVEVIDGEEDPPWWGDGGIMG